jgi:hypothetical protein
MNSISTSLYNIESIRVDTLGVNFEYPKITPAGSAGFGGNIDILNNFRWKSNDGLTDEVPYVSLMEYELPFGQWTSRLSNLLTAGKTALYTAESDPYIKLYSGNPTGFSYTFPYLLRNGDSVRGSGVSNNWNDVDIGRSISKIPVVGPDLRKAFNALENAAQITAETFTPGYGAEKIMNFADTAKKSITITFPLYNTLSEQEAINNFNFVNLFALQNLKTRTSWLTFIPPKLYMVEGVGLGSLYMPAAYVSSYDFKAIGTTRYVKDGAYDKGYLIPEAYKVSITLKELVAESSNIMWGALGGPKVSIISTPASRAAATAAGVQVNIPTGGVSIGVPQ